MEIVKEIKGQRGVTLIALSITVLVLIIIAGVTIYSGKEVVKKAKIEEVRTNMLLIKAKAKEYVEECDFLKGPSPNGEQENNARAKAYGERGLTETITMQKEGVDLGVCYKVGEEALKQMGLEKIDSDDGYVIKFDETNLTAEIYMSSEQDETIVKYSLTELNEKEEK